MAIDRVEWALPGNPNAYRSLSAHFVSVYASRTRTLGQVLRDLSRLARGIVPGASLHGRIKSIESILFKMRRDGRDLDHVFDVLGVRVIVFDTMECYRVVEQIHRSFRFLEAEVDDYVKCPKPNGYQSLHTTILSPDGHPVEVQVRTEQMHVLAVQGAAAHWFYKEQGLRSETRMAVN